MRTGWDDAYGIPGIKKYAIIGSHHSPITDEDNPHVNYPE